jgi:hypothetical protein
MSNPRSPWDDVFDAMREDEQMRAGSDLTLFQKEHREDKAQTQYIDDMNADGIAVLPAPKPDLFA